MKSFNCLTRMFVPYILMIAGGVLAFAVVLTFVVSIWRDIEISAWNIVAAQVARWFALFLGVYVIHNLLPIAVAHGRTRREFLSNAALYAVVASATLAISAQIGFVVERWIYGVMDWTSDTVGAGFLDYWLMFAVWMTVGAFIAAGFDRFEGGGLLTIPVGFALILPVGSLVHGANSLPFVRDIRGIDAGTGMVLSIGTFLVALALAWLIARDMPVRAKAA